MTQLKFTTIVLLLLSVLSIKLFTGVNCTTTTITYAQSTLIDNELSTIESSTNEDSTYEASTAIEIESDTLIETLFDTTTTSPISTTTIETIETILSPTTTINIITNNSDSIKQSIYVNEEAVDYFQAKCQPGLLLPVWLPQSNLTLGDRISRGLIYFLVLCYLFLGVSIVSDQFMSAIEMITAKEKEIRIRKGDGTTQILCVRVWNETVANLTLMALGTSGPEILLSIIEIFSKNFQAGDLGPGTIVGSAAYNLFSITALCSFVIPNGEVRRIKHLRVFFVTCAWSIFAYIWLYLILAVITPGEVNVWEGLLTFLFFPITVGMAFVADRRLLIYKYLSKDYRMNKRGIMVKSEAGSDIELKNFTDNIDTAESGKNEDDIEGIYSDTVRDLENTRNEYLVNLKSLRKQYPGAPMENLEIMAQEQLMSKTSKSRAYYRVQATRKMIGVQSLAKKIADRTQRELNEMKMERKRSTDGRHSIIDDDLIDSDEIDVAKFYFEQSSYTVMENCGKFTIKVIRSGDFSGSITVDYETEDGTAEAGTDYYSTSGTLVFPPGITEQTFTVEVIDDEMFEQDEYFYIRLKNVSDGGFLGIPRVVTVMILDDDHGGIFAFTSDEHELIETVGVYELKVQRSTGARGKVILPYWTENGTAKGGKDFEAIKGNLEFENNESEKIIPLVILEEGSYEKDVLFYVNLGAPQMVGDELANAVTEAEAKAPEDLTEFDKMALLGRPKAGDIIRAQLRIKESKEFKNTVDKLVQRANASLLIGTSSWKEQFAEALTVSAGDDASGDSEDPPKPSCGDYIMHFLTVFWKLIFAFIPPTDMYSGYLCFVVSITCIGIVTAIIGDVASHFGCTLGIKDSVTAIVFVALGTSIPDTFASKVAAIQDKHADASVGNVTGSNAVNVFLGIGVAWTIAAVYHAYHGNSFKVEPGNLAFSVTLFCTEALIAIAILLARRSKAVGGELGGPRLIKYLTSLVLFGLWIFYLVMSSLEAYGVIKGF